ncbi:Hypothetical predicted protein, partial [Marmota monax]
AHGLALFAENYGGCGCNNESNTRSLKNSLASTRLLSADRAQQPLVAEAFAQKKRCLVFTSQRCTEV